jgi:DNA-binding transcriptional ArsR family regulator
MEDRMELTREITLPATAEEVWRSLEEPAWLGEDAQIELHPDGEVRAGDRTGFVEEVEEPRRLVFWWAAPDEARARRGRGGGRHARAGSRVAPARDAGPLRRRDRVLRPAAAPPAGDDGSLMDPADAVFGALSDGTRRRLLALLGERGEASATDLARELPVTRQAVQKHLGILSGAGLVAARRAGREVLYRPTPAPMSEAMAWMAEVGAQWDDRLAALERQFAASGQTKA